MWFLCLWKHLTQNESPTLFHWKQRKQDTTLSKGIRPFKHHRYVNKTSLLYLIQCMNNANFLSIQAAPPTMPDQFFSFPLCLAVLSAHGVSRATLMCGDTWQARWPLGLSLITLDPNPSGIKPAKPNSHCGSWLASAGTAAEGEDAEGCTLPKIRRETWEDLYANLECKQLENWRWKYDYI